MQIHFRVGQKVVCVDGEEHPRLWCPKTGGVYTIRSVFVWDDCPYIRLEEYRHRTRSSGPWGEGGWNALRFRPVVEPGTETGMSILRELLNTQDKPLEVV